jgi:hypothetical protein
MKKINFENLEWEILQKPLTIEKMTPKTDLSRKTVHLDVNRNDSYLLRANLTAIEKEEAVLTKDIDIYFTEEPFTIEGYDQNNSRIKLESCSIIRRSSQHIHNKDNFEIKLELVPEEIIIEKNIDSEVSCVSEWYLNGPHDESGRIVFPRRTVRYRDKGSDQVLRKRSTIDVSEEEARRLFLYNSGQMPSDFAYID